MWILNLCCFIAAEIIEYQFLLRTPEQVGDMSGRYFDERFLVNFCLVNALTVFVTVRKLAEGRIKQESFISARACCLPLT